MQNSTLRDYIPQRLEACEEAIKALGIPEGGDEGEAGEAGEGEATSDGQESPEDDVYDE